MVTNDRAELLDILACDLQARPRGAPGIDDLIGSVQAVQREPGALVITFAADAAYTVAAFAGAERECCPGLGWEVAHTPLVTLRITGTPAQLDALAAVFG